MKTSNLQQRQSQQNAGDRRFKFGREDQRIRKSGKARKLLTRTASWGGVLLLIFILSGATSLLNAIISAPNANAAAITAANPADIPGCHGEAECFAFTIDTRLTSTGATTGTSKVFSVPASDWVNGSTAAAINAYNWSIDWGDGTVSTASGSDSNRVSAVASLSHTYAAAGPYQITLRPATTATSGWMNAFGFSNGSSSANAYANKYMFRSIDTPFTNLMRTQGATYRFAYMFYGADNAIGIPANLFANISTAGDTNFSVMFYYTFYHFAYNNSSATIPAGLFSSFDTSSGTNFGSMFANTFMNYAYNSTAATIPSDLFSFLNTSSGTSVSGMFRETFEYYAYNNSSATIPAGLFDHLDTSLVTGFDQLFYLTFNYYAYNSTVGTIPAGLFSSLNTSKGTGFTYTFSTTFGNYAYYSTVGTIPAGLFSSLNISKGTAFGYMFERTFADYAYNSTVGTVPANLFSSIIVVASTSTGYMFSNTFLDYARRQATFVVNGAVVSTAAFQGPYAVRNVTTNIVLIPSSTVGKNNVIAPTYDASDRTFAVPVGYDGYDWYRTDGTSCAVANPTPDCGAQTAATQVSLPDATEWVQATSTEKGNVTLYSERTIADVTFDSGGGSAVPEQTVNLGDLVAEPTAPTRDGYVFAGWFTDEDLSEKWVFSAPVASDMTLFAKWTAVYQVTFVDFDGNVIDEQAVFDGEAATAPTPPERDGYEFTGWSESFDAVVGDLVVTALYEKLPEPVVPAAPLKPTEPIVVLPTLAVPNAPNTGAQIANDAVLGSLGANYLIILLIFLQLHILLKGVDLRKSLR